MAKKRNPAEETDSDLLIDMQDIVKTFNIGTPNELTILHGVNFNLARGEFLSVVGTSGSGKSTLMNIIGLLDKPTSGTYNLDGVDVLELSDDKAALYRSKHIGFVFQNFNLIGRISASQCGTPHDVRRCGPQGPHRTRQPSTRNGGHAGARRPLAR